MGRSVSYPSDAIETVFLPYPSSEDDPDEDWEWEDFKDDLSRLLRSHYPSLTPDLKWEDREEQRILSNTFARIVVSAYGNLVSVSLCPSLYSPGYSDTSSHNALAESWCYRQAPYFFALLKKHFTTYTKVGNLSNGEGVYTRS